LEASLDERRKDGVLRGQGPTAEVGFGVPSKWEGTEALPSQRQA
jgi:hypothetical protein